MTPSNSRPRALASIRSFFVPLPAGKSLALLLLALFCIIPSASRAATYYWDGDAGTGAANTLNYVSGIVSTTNTNWWSATGSAYTGWSNSALDVMQIGSNSAQSGRSYTGGSTAGSFSLTLSGSISLGELVISGNLSSGGTNSVTITDGGNASNYLNFGGANEIQNNSSNTLIIDAQIASAGGTFFDQSSGTVIFTKNNNYNTGTTIEGNGSSSAGGLLQIGNGGATGALGTGQIQFLLNTSQTSASTLRFDRSDAISVANSINVLTSNTVGAIIQQSGGNTLTLSGSETISSASASMTYNIGSTGQAVDTLVSGAITGSGAVVKSGAGALEFSGNDTYTGQTTIGAGTLIIAGTGKLGGGNYAGNIVNNGVFTYDSMASQTLGGLISGTGALNQNGPGALTLSSTETYSGATTVNAGNLTLAGFNSGGGLQGALLNSSVTVNPGGTFQFGTAANYGNATAGSAPAVTNIAQNVTLNSGAFTVLGGTSGNTATAAGLSGTLTLASGLNTVTLNNGSSSVYTGLTTAFLRDPGATLLVNAFPNSSNIGNTSPGAAGNENLLFTSGTALTGGVLAGVFIAQTSGSGDATTIAQYNSTDGVQVGGNAAYSGSTGTLANASLPIASVTSNYTGTGSGSANSLRMDASLNLGGNTLTVNSGVILARSGTISITSGTLALGAEGQIYVSNNNSAHTGNTPGVMSISSVITGSNGLTYTGGWTGQGTLTLSGNSSYTGATTINTGALLVTGSLGGTTSAAINSTGVLGGSGALGALSSTGTTIVNSGGAIAPGATLNSAGTMLTINNNVTFNNGGIFTVNLSSTNGVSDLLAINGNLTLSGSTILNLNLVNGSLASGGSYEIASYTGTLSGAFLTPANLPVGYSVDYTHAGMIFVDVPEPGAFAMMLGGIGTLAGIRKIRRRALAPG